MNTFKKLALSLALTGLVAGQAGATVAYTFPAGNQSFPGDGPYSLGDAFTVNSSMVVDALGVIGGSGSTTADVAIYSITLDGGNNITGGSMVASATGVASGAMQSISSVILGSGTYMIVANNMGFTGVTDYNPSYDSANGGSFGSPATSGVNGITAASSALVTFSSLGYYAASGTLPGTLTGSSFSLDNGWSSGGPRFGAGNFDFAPVPEIGVFGTASAALLGLVYVGRCGLRKRKLV